MLAKAQPITLCNREEWDKFDNYYLADHFPALVLTGAPQPGKTTLLRHCFPGHRCVTLDLPSVAEQAERDPDSFSRSNAPFVVVDEVQ